MLSGAAAGFSWATSERPANAATAHASTAIAIHLARWNMLPPRPPSPNARLRRGKP